MLGSAEHRRQDGGGPRKPSPQPFTSWMSKLRCGDAEGYLPSSQGGTARVRARAGLSLPLPHQRRTIPPALPMSLPPRLSPMCVRASGQSESKQGLPSGRGSPNSFLGQQSAPALRTWGLCRDSLPSKQDQGGTRTQEQHPTSGVTYQGQPWSPQGPSPGTWPPEGCCQQP